MVQQTRRSVSRKSSKVVYFFRDNAVDDDGQSASQVAQELFALLRGVCQHDPGGDLLATLSLRSGCRGINTEAAPLPPMNLTLLWLQELSASEQTYVSGNKHVAAKTEIER